VINYEVIGYDDLRKSHLKSVRATVETKTLNLTVITGVKIDIKVIEGLVKQGGILSSNYLSFEIITKGVINFDVRRKETDFYFLRKILQKQFPHIIIPPLPKKQGKHNPKSIKKREKYFTRFL
jgi:hypothetical protein